VWLYLSVSDFRAPVWHSGKILPAAKQLTLSTHPQKAVKQEVGTLLQRVGALHDAPRLDLHSYAVRADVEALQALAGGARLHRMIGLLERTQ
jgi:hypothetical protein